MKKLLYVLGLMFILAGISNAASTGTYLVKMTIVEESVAIQVDSDNGTADLGYVMKGSSVTSRPQGKEIGTGRTITKNVGAANVTLKLKITAKPTDWITGTTSLDDIAANKFVLATVYTIWVATTNLSDFQDGDVITESDKIAAATTGNFVNDDNSPGVPATDVTDGYNIPPAEEVNNFYYFKAPSSLSNADQYNVEQVITVTVTAVQQL